jgi:hypothetical protein
MAGANRVSNGTNLSAPAAHGNEPPLHAALEPYVDADDIASFIGESRRNVLRMAREGRLTCYPMSGSQRHTYKFKRSEVSRDIEKLRRPSGTAPEERSNARFHKR